MSYILDALKKAESERQLGNVPGVHAQAATSSTGKPLVSWLIVGLLALIVILLVWRTLAPVAPSPSTAPATAPPAAVATASATQPTPATNTERAMQAPAVVAGAPAPAAPAMVSASPVPKTAQPLAQVPGSTSESSQAQTTVLTPPVAASVQPASAVESGRQIVPKGVPAKELAKELAAAPVVAAPSALSKASIPAGAAVSKAAPAAATSTTPAPGKLPAPASLPAEVDADESLPLLAQLPEVIQREVPAIAVKGYMYSRNPADRVLIIGSNFHHEGEDFPNGVRLEKLLPKAAVFSYKGFRYRVAY